MEGLYFAFAVFIFALVCAAFFIWKKVYLSIKAPDRFEREVNWAKRYQDLENRIDAFEAYVDGAQEDIRQEKAELRRMIAGAEEIYRKLSGGQDIDAPVIVTLGASKANYPRKVRKKPIVVDEVPDAPIEEEPPLQEESPIAEMVDTTEIPVEIEEMVEEIAEADKAENSKNDDVLWMHRSGFSNEKIAQQLSITRNEVKLILELWENQNK